MKGKCYSNVEVFRQANWNGSMESLVIDWAKEEANILAYLCLLLVIKFLSRLCNMF